MAAPSNDEDEMDSVVACDPSRAVRNAMTRLRYKAESLREEACLRRDVRMIEQVQALLDMLKREECVVEQALAHIEARALS